MFLCTDHAIVSPSPTDQNVKREEGYTVQLQNINAAASVADVIRTSLGPCAMLKMLLDPMGGIVLTNDGNAILREIDVSHPAAKAMVEISRTQDEEVGDGTTSVIILTGEMLSIAQPFLRRKLHPSIVVSAYSKALDDMIDFLENSISIDVDVSDKEQMLSIVRSSIGTKFARQWSDMVCNIAVNAVKVVALESNGRQEVDIKRYAKIEKIPGGDITESQTLSGVMLNKDVTHASMRRLIKNPRIVLLDCTLEYKKGESQTNVEIVKEEDWNALLKHEEEVVKQMCDSIIAVKPDLVITEKGVSDLAQHWLTKAGITAIRRVRKSDNNRIARATGATIATRPEELTEEMVGTQCGLFEVKKMGDEYYTFLTECKEPKACTILLRGASKDVLNEVERNLQDAMCVARNVMLSPKLCPGGGATEMALAALLTHKADSIEGVQQWPYKAVASALEVIPRTLIQNCGANVIRTLTKLRATHAQEGMTTWGVDGETGKLVDMKDLGVWEPLAVKLQTVKTAIETASMLLRIDMIVSGLKRKKDPAAQ
ncbi:T-complex protein 1 subunit gamma [Sphaeroforma arctica JP610]|uniref:T-complex protein 1 subunit gamma n=1 Tax=Sphaeroforma arctica JP610 TaxID=667725 RepID=A0A0L0FJV5_9EUKA|nr:T-complex protein 1 subunit gamma [Sphaeroforma arctica JP610]KNC77057.1 T-complex protein 1 subunit gamma [Sphaeroforma arctica JP610]|eukprot:XP_014150959.1 T-complex protein 1 subunit gamma [Sphaeroforma arctica JP610]